MRLQEIQQPSYDLLGCLLWSNHGSEDSPVIRKIVVSTLKQLFYC